MSRRRRVLVIDDDDGIRQFVALALSDEGYEVVVAKNGEVGLRLATEQHPSLILLDMRMPEMDGRAFAGAYRAGPGPHAPIVALTAGREPGDVGAELSAVAFLAKPYNLDDLIELVARHVESDGAG